MLARLCQLKTLVILLALCSSCSWKKEKKPEDTELQALLRDQKSGKGHPQYDWRAINGEKQGNIFFDLPNNVDQGTGLVQIIPLSTTANDYYYQVDMSSGQRFFDHEWCPTKDAWRKYNGNLKRPPFIVGVIPGVLDLLGSPQKVFIFGATDKYKSIHSKATFKVQLLGSVVQQVCIEGSCSGKINWPSRLVYIAVDPDDAKLGKIKTIQEFKEKIDYPEVKAYIENIDGINTLGKNEFPTGSIGELISYEATSSFQEKYSLSIDPNERKKMIRSCHAVYEMAWREVGVKTAFDKPAISVDEMKEKVRIRQELKKAKVPIDFNERLRSFTNKHYNHFVTCMKFVRFPSVNIVPEKFWFLTDIGIFYLLHSEGHYFDCGRKSWGRNTLNNEGELVHNLKEELSQCSTKDIDSAFNYLPSYLTGLRNSQKFYYRFLDYDSHTQGTHAKIYGWVKFRKFESSCESKVNNQVLQKSIVAPVDHRWEPRGFTEGKENEFDVIL